MKKYIILGLLAVILVSVGFSFRKTEPDLTGVIFNKGDGDILVVVGLDDINISFEDMLNLGKRAVSLSVTDKTVIQGQDGQKILFSDLKEGDTVKVWVSGPIAESYPEQAEAKTIVVAN